MRRRGLGKAVLFASVVVAASAQSDACPKCPHCHIDHEASTVSSAFAATSSSSSRFVLSLLSRAYFTLRPLFHARKVGSGTAGMVLTFSFVVILVCFSGMFSGLTLGLLGLDKIGLEIVMGGEDEKLKRFAQRIAPVRENGNLLLCTLLLGNVGVSSLLSIIMADMTSGLMGFLTSTIVIVIFGEIIPQASCSRYALRIGSMAVPMVRVIMVLLYPFAKPIASALDWLLDEEARGQHSSLRA